MPPSATEAEAERVSVVVSMVSVMVVTAAVGSIATRMPPPLVLLMVALTLLGSTYASSLGATATVVLAVN